MEKKQLQEIAKIDRLINRLGVELAIIKICEL